MDLLAGHMEMYTALHTQNVSAECQATSPSWLTDNVPRSGQKNQPTSQAFLLNMDMEQTTGSLLHFDPDDSLTKEDVLKMLKSKTNSSHSGLKARML